MRRLGNGIVHRPPVANGLWLDFLFGSLFTIFRHLVLTIETVLVTNAGNDAAWCCGMVCDFMPQ